MGRSAVQVEPVLLDVLAVVALAVGEPEHPLLQDRIGAVPQRECEAQPLALVAHPRDSVLAPPVRPRPGVVVREVVPRVAAAAVVLPDRPPLALAQVWTPGLPGCGTRAGLFEAPVLRRAGRGPPRGHFVGVSPSTGAYATLSAPGGSGCLPVFGRAGPWADPGIVVGASPRGEREIVVRASPAVGCRPSCPPT